jgi:GT2 family glycosyltransferase
MSTLTIVIPVYLSHSLHAQFTKETIDSIKSKHSLRTVIIVNHTTPEFEPFLTSQKVDHLIYSPKNSLSKAWNMGIKYGLQKNTDYILILNNDIVLHPKAIDHLVIFAAKHPEFLLWSGVEHDNLRTLAQSSADNSYSHHPHFSCFMLNRRSTETVGFFDENLDTAYFEDNDYHIRILLSGHHAAATTTARFYHYGSRTAQVDDSLRLKLKPFYQKNRRYIEKKWGIDLHGKGFSPPEKILDDIFPRPFNRPDMTLKDW